MIPWRIVLYGLVVTVVPRVDLAFLLNQTSYALAGRMAARLAGLGITPRVYCVLTKAEPGGLTQNQIAEQAALDKTTMVVTLDEMERAGLAERLPHATDRRARLVNVTPAGREVLDHAHAIVAGVYDEVLGSLSAADREAFVAGLSALAAGPLAEPSHLRPLRRRTARST